MAELCDRLNNCDMGVTQKSWFRRKQFCRVTYCNDLL